MSRLDSAIRRLEAQRLCLDAAVRHLGERPGPVIELGLGNGRTYDHLRERMPGRPIYVFERQVAAHPDCVPTPKYLVLGDFHDSFAGALERIGTKAVLAHADIGSGELEATRALADWLGGALPALLAPAAIVVSDQPLPLRGAVALDLPAGVAAGRYFLWRMPD